jgi:hypothetical protein
VIVFLIGAVGLSIVVLWRKQCWYVYLLGLLFWAMVCSVVMMLSVIGYELSVEYPVVRHCLLVPKLYGLSATDLVGWIAVLGESISNADRKCCACELVDRGDISLAPGGCPTLGFRGVCSCVGC